MTKKTEYWVGTRGDDGDLIEYRYQGPSKSAALKDARAALGGDHDVTVERVTRWWDGEDLEDEVYEDVAIS
jgi:hypothetical protein